MKKVFKFIFITIMFILSLSIFNQVMTFIGKGGKKMAKLF